MSTQAIWAHALLNPEQPAPGDLVTWNHSDPLRRLAVYRNNVMVSLVDALAQTFPVTQQLVGEEFFRAMGQIFVRAHPPRTRVLAQYGAGLPAFIAQFPPAASLPYLADVAQLEMYRLQALHAADTPSMPAQAITALLQDAEALPSVRWDLAPSLHVLCSSHAAVSIWAAHQDGSGVSLEDIDLDRAESALVFRSDLDVMVLPSAAGLTALVLGLQGGGSLQQACERASEVDPDLDLPQALAVLVRHDLFVGAQRPR